MVNKTVSSLSVYESAYVYCLNQAIIISKDITSSILTLIFYINYRQAYLKNFIIIMLTL